MPQEQKRTQRKGGGDSGEAGQAEATEKAEKLKEEMDDILDEIDSVLEENAAEDEPSAPRRNRLVFANPIRPGKLVLHLLYGHSWSAGSQRGAGRQFTETLIAQGFFEFSPTAKYR